MTDFPPLADEQRFELGVDSARAVRWLAASATVLLVVHAGLQCVHYLWFEMPWWVKDRFDVDVENSVPTWFSGALLLLAAGLLFCIAQQKKRMRDPWAVYWGGLTAGFFVLSIDEIAGFHECVNTLTESTWTLYGAIGAGLVALAYTRFLWHLPIYVFVRMVCAGCLYLGGALGIERASDWFVDHDAIDTLGYNLVNVLEEGGEMFGVIVFIAALLKYTQTERLSWVWHPGEPVASHALEPSIGVATSASSSPLRTGCSVSAR